MYAAWAGHLSYRVFMKHNNSTPLVYFIPTVTNDPPLVQFFNQSGFTVGNFTKGTVNMSFQVDAQWTSMIPLEVSASRGDVGYYIDVSIPFNTILNFLPTEDWVPPSGDATNQLIRSLGWLVFLFTPNNNGVVTDPSEFDIYQKTTDDFAFGIFRPPAICQFYPFVNATGNANNVTDLNVAGFYS
jgi:hypothetical protein